GGQHGWRSAQCRGAPVHVVASGRRVRGIRVPQSLGGAYEPELVDAGDPSRALGRAQGRGSHSDARADQRGLGTMSIPAFDGFRRSDGSVGVRNHMLVMSVTGLTGPTARRI